MEDKKVCRDLEKAGVKVNSVYDLANSKTDYKVAIPVLLKWLSEARTAPVLEGIVRALTLKSAGEEVGRALINQFEKTEVTNDQQQNIKWAIGNAIAEVATPAVIEELYRLALEKKHGKSRQMIVMALGKKGKKRRQETIHILVELLRDPDVQGHALVALGYLKPKEVQSSIDPFVKHENAWIRQEARRALAKAASGK